MIKNGYWRENELSDDIVLCENKQELCEAKVFLKNQICIEGFTGALCESCDTQKDVWDTKYGNTGYLSCDPCG
jgi:hypothetical protein